MQYWLTTDSPITGLGDGQGVELSSDGGEGEEGGEGDGVGTSLSTARNSNSAVITGKSNMQIPVGKFGLVVMHC